MLFERSLILESSEVELNHLYHFITFPENHIFIVKFNSKI